MEALEDDASIKMAKERIQGGKYMNVGECCYGCYHRLRIGEVFVSIGGGGGIISEGRFYSALLTGYILFFV